MPVYARHVLFLSLVALVACSSPTQGGATPSIVQTNSASGHEVFQKLSIRPNANLPATLINFVSNGPAQGGVPCINCVTGAQTHDNVGLSGPSSYVPTGAVWQYTLSFTDLAYKGKCKLDWSITSGKKTIDTFSATVNLTSAGGFVIYGVDRNRPKYSGAATLTGKYTCGKDTQSTQAPLQFE
jgi:hypothetical protein